MATIEQQLTELVNQKNALATNLNTKGVTASTDETLNTLVPKVLDIETGGGGDSGNTFGKFHIEQIIFGDTCELVITEIGSEQANNYMIGQIQSSNSNELYIYDQED